MKLTDIFFHTVLPLLMGAFLYANSQWLANAIFVRFYAADALWAYAFASALLIVWDRRPPYPWLAVAFLAAILFEWFQHMGTINGAGDPFDLLAYGMGFLTALLVNHYFKHQFAT